MITLSDILKKSKEVDSVIVCTIDSYVELKEKEIPKDIYPDDKTLNLFMDVLKDRDRQRFKMLKTNNSEMLAFELSEVSGFRMSLDKNKIKNWKNPFKTRQKFVKKWERFEYKQNLRYGYSEDTLDLLAERYRRRITNPK